MMRTYGLVSVAPCDQPKYQGTLIMKHVTCHYVDLTLVSWQTEMVFVVIQPPFRVSRAGEVGDALALNCTLGVGQRTFWP